MLEHINFKRIDDEFESGEGNKTDVGKQQKLIEIKNNLNLLWQKILIIDDITDEDSFLDLGGSSLKAIELECEIEMTFNVEISLEQIFENLTISSLADIIINLDTNYFIDIESSQEQENYPLSYSQKEIFIANNYSEDSIDYHLSFVRKINGKVDIPKLNAAFNLLIKRHGILRTHFTIKDGEPVQIVNNKVEFQLEYFETEEDCSALIDNLIRPFVMETAPLLRAGLIKTGLDKYVIVIDVHQIIADGTSLNIFLKELIGLYEEKELPLFDIEYKDYAVWQDKLFRSEDIKKREKYWLENFLDDLPVLELPADYMNINVDEFPEEQIHSNIPKNILSEISKVAKNHDSTVNMVLLAAYVLMLSKHSGQEDIVVGTISTGRQQTKLNGVLGPFSRSLPIRFKVDYQIRLEQFLKYTRQKVLGAYENQEYMFNRISEMYIERYRQPIRSLFNTIWNFHTEVKERLDLNMGNLQLENFDRMRKNAKMDLQFDLYEETNGDLSCFIRYNSSLYKEETIERMLVHFQNTLREIIHNSKKSICEIDMLSENEKEMLLLKFNNTYLEYDSNKTVIDLFESQVQKTPDDLALVYGDSSMTYYELNEKSNQIARVLREQGAKRNSFVGLIVERSMDMITAILGTLKSGSAYIPIDPEMPQERIDFIIKDSKINILLTQNHISQSNSFKGRVLDISNSNFANKDSSNLNKINEMSDIVYAIYTSGSTGNPKGVVIEHNNLTAYLHAFSREFDLNKKDVVLQQASYSFDAFVEEVFPALIFGAKVVILKKEQHQDLNLFIDIINKYKVTILSCSPLLLNELNQMPIAESVRVYASGGDVFKPGYFSNLIRKANVYNTYGPTEATIGATCHKCSENEEGNIPIGRVISNYKIFILDKYNNLAPIGVPGEICIGGVGVARGYLNQPELTKERFISSPFNSEERIYKTGDIGRWLPIGEIEYLGRIDRQVKIRGYRIELGEIERALLNDEIISDAIVMDREDNSGNKYLCAYIVSKIAIDIDKAQRRLKKKLPQYMIPNKIVQLEKIPVTINGKVDLSALPIPNIEGSKERKYTAPRNELEEMISIIWKEALKLNEVGVMDNFFDLGGNSLRAIVISTKMHENLEVHVPISEIFNNPTVEELAIYVNGAEKAGYHCIEPADEMDYYPVTSSQKRLYIMCQFEEESIAYNIPSVMMLEGKLDVKKVEYVFKMLIQRHEALRTAFVISKNELVQKIYNEVDFKLTFEQIKEDEIDEHINKFTQSFELDKPPLMRGGLFEFGIDKYMLIMDIHHLIADGRTISILLTEFTKMYSEQEIPELTLQFKDFAVWQNELLKSKTMQEQEKFWLEMFNSEIPLLNMPIDFNRKDNQSFRGETICFQIGEDLTYELKKLAVETGTTLYMVLFSAYNILLSFHAYQDDIIVGTPVAGRGYLGLEDIVGMFVNTLAIRSRINSEETYINFLLKIKENLLKAFECQDYQLDMLLEKLNIDRIPNRNPLFDVLFSFRKENHKPTNYWDFTMYEYFGNNNKISKFDLSLILIEEEETIRMELEYCTDLFHMDTISKISGNYMNILNFITINANEKIGNIVMEIVEQDENLFENIEFNF